MGWITKRANVIVHLVAMFWALVAIAAMALSGK